MNQENSGAGNTTDRYGIVFINLGSLFAQTVQIAGYPTLLALALARADYPSWLIGVILSFQWVVVLLLAPFVPTIMSRVGIRQSCQLGAAISLLAVALLLAPLSTPVITVSALLMGAGLTVRWVACDTWIVEIVPEKLRGRAIGVHETLMGLGIAIGPLLTMVSSRSETAAVGIYIMLLVVSFGFFSLGPHVHAAVPEEAHRKGRRLVVVFQILFLALLAALVSGYIETAMVALLPLYLNQFHYPESQALIFLSVFGLGGTILQTPLGWIADRWSFRAGQILCLSLITIGGLLLITMIGSAWVVIPVLFVWGGCVGGLNTLAVIEAGSTLKAGLSGSGMALIASSYTLGGVVGPTVSGAALGWAHGHGAIVVIIGLMILYAVTLLYAGRRSMAPART